MLPCTRAQIKVYVDRVIACYLREHGRVEGLAAKDDGEWNQLCEQLGSRAYNMLLSLQVAASRAAGEAADFAQETCEVIACHGFPYDVSFDGWTTLILQRRILQHYTRSPDVMDQRTEVQSLDRPMQEEGGEGFSLYHILSDGSDVSIFEMVDTQEWLLQGVARLKSQAQQQVVVGTFFYELSDEEIARRLGKTRQAVYNLRQRALRRLKEILEE